MPRYSSPRWRVSPASESSEARREEATGSQDPEEAREGLGWVVRVATRTYGRNAAATGNGKGWSTAGIRTDGW